LGALPAFTGCSSVGFIRALPQQQCRLHCLDLFRLCRFNHMCLCIFAYWIYFTFIKWIYCFRCHQSTEPSRTLDMDGHSEGAASWSSSMQFKLTCSLQPSMCVFLSYFLRYYSSNAVLLWVAATGQHHLGKQTLHHLESRSAVTSMACFGTWAPRALPWDHRHQHPLHGWTNLMCLKHQRQSHGHLHWWPCVRHKHVPIRHQQLPWWGWQRRWDSGELFMCLCEKGTDTCTF